jgi:hypothetical protein
VEPLKAVADDVAGRYDLAADGLLRHDRAELAHRSPPPAEADWPTDLGRDLYDIADLRVWLDGLRDDLGRVADTAPPEPDPADLRLRVTHLADGATG